MRNLSKNLLKLMLGAALIVLGLFAIPVGFVTALVAGPEWLFISLGGLLVILCGILMIRNEIKSFKTKLRRGVPIRLKSRLK